MKGIFCVAVAAWLAVSLGYSCSKGFEPRAFGFGPPGGGGPVGVALAVQWIVAPEDERGESRIRQFHGAVSELC